MNGIIKGLRRDKGFGFITRDDGQDSYFHARSMKIRDFQTLHTGDKVSFDLGENESGPVCVNISVIASAAEGKQRGIIFAIYRDYCFIRPHGQEKSLFAHRSEFDRDVDEADHNSEVTFDTFASRKGSVCKNVRVVTPKYRPVPETGTITKLLATYAFVERDSNGESLFCCHFQSPEIFIGPADIGRRVALEVIERERGPVGIRLRFIEAA